MIPKPGRWGALLLWLGFTLPRVAHADPPQQTMPFEPGPETPDPKTAAPPTHWIDDPYQPHDTTGPNLRMGSAVGWIIHDEKQYTVLGPELAFGPRFGRFTLEATYLFGQLSEPGPSTYVYGYVNRLGLMGRADVLRFGPHTVGPNSMLALYLEGGMARQSYHWYRPDAGEQLMRQVPVDAARSTAVVGFGLNLDHRLEQPAGFPSRIGWQLGWQLTTSPRGDMSPTVECRGTECIAGPVSTGRQARDTSLLVTSTIAFTW